MNQSHIKRSFSQKKALNLVIPEKTQKEEVLYLIEKILDGEELNESEGDMELELHQCCQTLIQNVKLLIMLRKRREHVDYNPMVCNDDSVVNYSV